MKVNDGARGPAGCGSITPHLTVRPEIFASCQNRCAGHSFKMFPRKTSAGGVLLRVGDFTFHRCNQLLQKGIIFFFNKQSIILIIASLFPPDSFNMCEVIIKGGVSLQHPACWSFRHHPAEPIPLATLKSNEKKQDINTNFHLIQRNMFKETHWYGLL